jgi:hypothetical protein
MCCSGCVGVEGLSGHVQQFDSFGEEAGLSCVQCMYSPVRPAMGGSFQKVERRVSRVTEDVRGLLDVLDSRQLYPDDALGRSR